MTKLKFIILCFLAFFAVGLSGFDSSQVQAAPNGIQVITDTKPATQSDATVPTTKIDTVANELTQRARSSWPWYVTRGSGLTAGVTLAILLLSGIGMITGYTYRFLEPITAWATHRALGIIFAISVAIHVISLLFDHFVPFNIIQILIPFTSDYKPISLFGYYVKSLYVALGVLSLYAVVAIVLTSLLWVDKKPKLWRLVHYLSYFVIIAIFIHALYLGTDLAHGILRWIWVGSGLIIAGSILHRLRRARTI
jgi:predicted ferric reductase